MFLMKVIYVFKLRKAELQQKLVTKIFTEQFRILKMQNLASIK